MRDRFASIDDIGPGSLVPLNSVVDLAMKAPAEPRKPPKNTVTFSGLGAVLDSHLPTDTRELAKLMSKHATREKGKVVVGRGPLPLHTDGILLRKHPNLIVLYACKFDDRSGCGETLICDKVKAWEEMPQRFRDILETKTFEYRIEEQNHYHDAPTG